MEVCLRWSGGRGGCNRELVRWWAPRGIDTVGRDDGRGGANCEDLRSEEWVVWKGSELMDKALR